jgi:hypothetical protein
MALDLTPSTWEFVHVLLLPQVPCKSLKEELAESPSTIVATPNAVVTPTPTHGAHFFHEAGEAGPSAVGVCKTKSGLVEVEKEGISSCEI